MSPQDIADPLTRELTTLGTPQPRLRLDQLGEFDNPSIFFLFSPLLVLMEELGERLR